MQKAVQTIRDYHMIQEGDRVLAGVSGGADSICLLMVLLDLQKEMAFALRVVHVEHGIRGEESLRDAAYVQEICGRFQVECTCVARDIPAMAKKQKRSEEEAGRIARYEIFEEIGKQWKATKIAVAHNQNDQAETILWNLARGSGLDGAAGIRPVREQIIRPLIACSRSEIEAFLQERHIQWCEDRTNCELDYTRNVIRNQILPQMEERLNTKTIEHLASFGMEMRRTEEFLEQMEVSAEEKMVRYEQERAILDLNAFRNEQPYLQERILRRILRRAGCGLKDIRRDHIEKAAALTKGQSGKKVGLPGGWQAVKSFETVIFGKEAEKEEEVQTEQQDILLQIPGETQTPWGKFTARILKNENQPIEQKKYTKWFSYDKIGNDIRLRSRRTGDYLMVHSSGGRKKLKAYLIEEKIPAERRNGIPLLVCGSEVLWVVGYRISEAYKIQKNTESILEITYKEEEPWQRRSK